MPPRRSRVASAISASIPPASCSVSSFTLPGLQATRSGIFRTPTAPGIC
jgi:hypothetical protein